jgi:hypothetical protein
MPFDSNAERRWLNDIHRHIVLAEQFAEGMSYDALHEDLRTAYSIGQGIGNKSARGAIFGNVISLIAPALPVTKHRNRNSDD